MPLTIRHRVTRDDDGARLDRVIARCLREAIAEPLSNAAVRRAIMAGLVRVDGRATPRPAYVLRDGMRIEASLDLARLRGASQPAPRIGPQDFLYADDDLLAVCKPSGIPTHAGADPRRADLVTEVRRFLAASPAWGGKPQPMLGVHQRLDRDTSGVIAFALSDRGNAALARAFAARDVTKCYHALVEAGALRRSDPLARDDEHVIRHPLRPSGSGRESRMRPHPQGAAAETRVRVLERLGPVWLVAAMPQTGRRHQIRAHLAQDGHPIVGDRRYGARELQPCPVGRVMLHAFALTIPRPSTGEPLSLEAPWPDDFRRAVDCFRSGRRT